MQSVIRVEKVGKRFVQYDTHRPVTLKEAFLRRFHGAGTAKSFWALREVSLEVGKGEIVGIIGRNGAGKSTLLRLVGGVGTPDTGNILVTGRVVGLLDLGTGFHPELTGRENTLLSGIIAGLTREEIVQRFDDIIEFAELEAFVDSPLRTYSTGMQLRLAFAVGVHTSPEVLLVDEVLAVGDMAFQRKCIEKILSFREQGCAILIVSHDTKQLKTLCDRVLWLKGGQIVSEGKPQHVVTQYESAMMTETQRRSTRSFTPGDTRTEARLGSMEMHITDVKLIDARGTLVEELASGAPLDVEIAYSPQERIESPIFSVTISDDEGRICLDTNTENLALPAVTGSGVIRARFERLDLSGGQYYVDVGAYSTDWSHVYDYHWHLYPLSITASGNDKGVLNAPHTWELGTLR